MLIILLGKFLLKQINFVKDDDTDIEKYHLDEISNPKEREIKEQLILLNNEKVDTIIYNYNKYPEELLEMLSKNADMLDFVIDYPEKQGNTYGDTVGKIQKGVVPLLLQWDKRWGYALYGDEIMAINGCGPTALSMVLVSLTGDNTITPYVIAKYAFENGYYDVGYGTSWSLMTDAPLVFGVESRELPLDKNVVMNTLNSGNPIICIMGKGDFTTTGHFIVLTGVKNGKLIVRDSNSIQRSNQLWDYDQISSQIKNLWTFELK